jgi:dihydrofolate reductase
MKLSMILAHANGMIGIDGQLPWHLSMDLQRFKSITDGHTVIMGRKCYESIGKPLPNRKEIVVTRNANLKVFDGVSKANTLEDAISMAEASGETEAFIIGGATLYDQAIGMADRIYVTEVRRSVPDCGHEVTKISERTRTYLTEMRPWFNQHDWVNCPANLLNDYKSVFYILDRELPCNYGGIYKYNFGVGRLITLKVGLNSETGMLSFWTGYRPVYFDERVVGYARLSGKEDDGRGCMIATVEFTPIENDATNTLQQLLDVGMEFTLVRDADQFKLLHLIGSQHYFGQLQF